MVSQDVIFFEHHFPYHILYTSSSDQYYHNTLFLPYTSTSQNSTLMLTLIRQVQCNIQTPLQIRYNIQMLLQVSLHRLSHLIHLWWDNLLGLSISHVSYLLMYVILVSLTDYSLNIGVILWPMISHHLLTKLLIFKPLLSPNPEVIKKLLHNLFGLKLCKRKFKP